MRIKYVYSAISACLLAGIIRSSPWIPRNLAHAAGEKLGELMFRVACWNSRRAQNGAGKPPQKTRRVFIDLSLQRSLEDLGYAFGSSMSHGEMRELVRKSYRNAGRSLIEVLRIPKLPVSKLLSLVDTDSFEPVRQVLDRGKGLIILTSHLGAWEVLASYLVHNLDRPLCAIVQRQRFSPYNSILSSIRNQGSQLKIIYQDDGARPVLAALRQNLPVVILADLDMPKLTGVYVQFFGRPAYTPVGPAALARTTGAGMVPVCIRWKAGSSADPASLRHQVHILPEIDLVRTPDKKADIQANTQRWTEAIEGIIREYPEQWIWFHRRWRTQSTAAAPGRPGAAEHRDPGKAVSRSS